MTGDELAQWRVHYGLGLDEPTTLAKAHRAAFRRLPLGLLGFLIHA